MILNHHHHPTGATTCFQAWRPQRRFCTLVRCFRCPVVRHLFLLRGLSSFRPAYIPWCLLTRVVYRVKSQPHPQLQTGGSGLLVYVPQRQMIRLYSQTLGNLLSRLLRRAWIKLGLIFFEATRRESMPFHCIDFYEPQIGSTAFHEALLCRNLPNGSGNTGIGLNTYLWL
jgi:hypothetical protein